MTFKQIGILDAYRRKLFCIAHARTPPPPPPQMKVIYFDTFVLIKVPKNIEPIPFDLIFLKKYNLTSFSIIS